MENEKTENVQMTEKAKEARRAYKRAWAKAHPELIRAQIARYWEKKAKKMEDAEDLIPDDLIETAGGQLVHKC